MFMLVNRQTRQPILDAQGHPIEALHEGEAFGMLAAHPDAAVLNTSTNLLVDVPLEPPSSTWEMPR